MSKIEQEQIVINEPIKTKLLDKSERYYDSLKELLAQMSDEQMTQPDAVGTWSIKNMLIHMTNWQWLLLEWLKADPQGEAPSDLPMSREGILEMNDGFIETQGDRSLQQVLSDFDETHQKTMQAIEATTEEQLTDGNYYKWFGGLAMGRTVAACTYHHYREHGEEFKEFLERVEASK